MAEKDKLPDKIKKVRVHQKHAYRFLSSALEVDEKADPTLADNKKALLLYENGVHELQQGIDVKLTESGEEFDRARNLQGKMEGNLLHAQSRIVDLTVSVAQHSTEEKENNDANPLPDTSRGKSHSNKPKSTTKKLNGDGLSKTSTKKPPFIASGNTPRTSYSVTKTVNKKVGPKEPSIDQTKKISNLKNVDSKHANLILNEVVEKGRGVSFDDIGGMENAKQILHEIVILPALRPEIFTGLRAPARGVLLFGPPGNGKTLLAKAVATEANAVFFNISAASLTSKWIGEGEKMVKAMFAVARELQPAIIFIDEIDSLLCERKDGENEATRRLKTEFLVGFDGVISDVDERILVMGATNRPWELDDAALRRLVKRLHVPLPDNETRRSILEKVLSKQPSHSLSEKDFKEIARFTTDYSGSDLAALAREAALMPIRNLSADQIKSVPANKVRNINVEDFVLAMKTIRPSVSSGYLDKFNDWNGKYGVLS